MLVASQAQDFAGAKWALGLRMRRATDAGVEKEFDGGAILRTHVLRPTWHFVTPDDIRWLLALTAPRVHAASGPRYRALGLDPATRSKAASTMARALEERGHLTRDELRAALAGAGIATEGQRTAYLLMHAELEAVICSGPRRGRQFTYALVDERAPAARRLDRESALAELARRYFPSRAPATVHDFAKWSGLTIRDARRAAEAAPPEHREEVMRRTATRRTPVAHLLSIYDEIISSYRDRRPLLSDPGDGTRLVGLGSALQFVFVVDGRIAGTWRRTVARRTVSVEVAPFRALTAPQKEAVSTAAVRFAKFLGRDLVVDLTIR